MEFVLNYKKCSILGNIIKLIGFSVFFVGMIKALYKIPLILNHKILYITGITFIFLSYIIDSKEKKNLAVKLGVILFLYITVILYRIY